MNIFYESSHDDIWLDRARGTGPEASRKAKRDGVVRSVALFFFHAPWPCLAFSMSGSSFFFSAKTLRKLKMKGM